MIRRLSICEPQKYDLLWMEKVFPLVSVERICDRDPYSLITTTQSSQHDLHPRWCSAASKEVVRSWQARPW
jgi:hypothetical protein